MNDLTLETARKLLDQYSCKETKIIASETERQDLQTALLLIVEQSEAENIGVCADNFEQGNQALSHYLKALGYNVSLDNYPIPEHQGAIYLKFNTSKMTYYSDTYTGPYRGVLVSCQSEDNRVNGIYGHLPLDLFA